MVYKSGDNDGDRIRTTEGRPMETSMLGSTSVPMSNLLRGFSLALDLTQGLRRGHAIRTAFMAMKIAEACKLTDAERSDVFYTAYLKDSGCPAAVDVLLELVGASDIAGHREFLLAPESPFARMRSALRAFRYGQPLPLKLVRLPFDLRTASSNFPGTTQVRCTAGRSIAVRLGLSADVQEALFSITERFDGTGPPRGLEGNEIPVAARIVAVSQLTDAYRALRSPDEAIQVMRERAGSMLDPDIVDVQLGLLREKHFLDGLEDPGIAEWIAQMDPMDTRVNTARDAIVDIAAAFGEVVDIKSRFTASHSQGVAKTAIEIGRELGMNEDDLWTLELAGQLHDIGKLGVPITILNKDGKLTGDEWAAVREHPNDTRRVLMATDLFAPIADVAANHHEKLDGTGYPLGLDSESLPLEHRVIAVADVFDALAAERPYRAAMPQAKVLKIIDGMAGPKLDEAVVAALRAAARASLAA